MKRCIYTALAAIILYSCVKSGENGPGGENPPPAGGSCDTANMKYTIDVVPILQANCYTCHGTNSNSGSSGIILEGYDNIKPYAQGGTLIGVISHAQGFIPMPQNAAKLSDCNINKIKSWIENGAGDD